MRKPAATQVATAPTAAQAENAAHADARDIPAVLAGVLVAARPAEARKPRRTATEGIARVAKATELHRCRCSQLVLESGEWTGCEKMVKGTFAPGHDAKAASLLVRAATEGDGTIFDEAAGVWRHVTEIFEGTKLGQKIAARLGDAEAVARQTAEVHADKTGVTGTETESLDAELAKKPGKTLMVIQHRRAGAYAGKTTETSEVADLAWEEVVHPADKATAGV